MYKYFRVIDSMNILIEVQDGASKQILEKYVNVYRALVLSNHVVFKGEATLYFTDSVKEYHKHHNTIIVGFELHGFWSLTDVSDGVVVLQILHTLMKEYLELEEKVTVNSEVSLKVDDIVSIESYNRKTLVNTLKRSYTSERTFKQWQAILKVHSFIEVHRGIMININYIDVFDDDVVYLKNATSMPVSRRKKAMLKYTLKVYGK